MVQAAGPIASPTTLSYRRVYRTNRRCGVGPSRYDCVGPSCYRGVGPSCYHGAAGRVTGSIRRDMRPWELSALKPSR